jgi:DNA uptake protein ComE-like DNA-binding protein
MNQDWLSLRLNPRLQRLRAKISADPYYRFQSAEEIAIAFSLGIHIDVNQATVDDWLRLPGLSIHQARLLSQLSQSGVKFYSIEDIAAALGVTAARLEPLKQILNFSYYDEEILAISPQLINPNTATVEMLGNIPFVDINLAEVIIKNRVEYGTYKNIIDFQSRLSLSGETLAQLMHYLKF